MAKCFATNRFISLLVICLGIAACNPGHPTATDATVPVRFVKAVLKDMPDTVGAAGSVEPINSVQVKSLVDGELLDVLVHDGEDVGKAQLLFRIDPRPAEAALGQANANVAKDRATLDQAQSEVKRNAPVAAKGYVSADQMQQYQTAVETAAASVAVDTASVASAKLNVLYTEIRAPIAGRSGRVLVQAGNLVKANDTNALLVINQIEPIYVNFAIPASLVAQVNAAQAKAPLDVRIPGASGAAAMDGVVAFVDNAVDSSSGTIRLRAQFDNNGHALWPGQLVNLRLTMGQDRNAVVVPDAVVQAGPDGSYVYVIDAQSKVHQRAVTILRSESGESIIASGLQAGESVVIDGQSRIQDGVSVTATAAGQ